MDRRRASAAHSVSMVWFFLRFRDPPGDRFAALRPPYQLTSLWRLELATGMRIRPRPSPIGAGWQAQVSHPAVETIPLVWRPESRQKTARRLPSRSRSATDGFQADRRVIDSSERWPDCWILEGRFRQIASCDPRIDPFGGFSLDELRRARGRNPPFRSWPSRIDHDGRCRSHDDVACFTARGRTLDVQGVFFEDVPYRRQVNRPVGIESRQGCVMTPHQQFSHESRHLDHIVPPVGTAA